MHDTVPQVFQQATAPVGRGSIGSGMRVVVADDVRDSVMTLGIRLHREGFEVRVASSGLEVFNAVQEFRPKAVLLDLRLPDRSGYAIAHQLTRDLGSKCPVLIAVTGRTDVDQLLNLLASLNTRL